MNFKIYFKNINCNILTWAKHQPSGKDQWSQVNAMFQVLFNIIFIWLKIDNREVRRCPTTCEWCFASALTQFTEGNDHINNSIDFYLSIYSIVEKREALWCTCFVFRCFVLQYLSYITQHFPAYSVFISAAPEQPAAGRRMDLKFHSCQGKCPWIMTLYILHNFNVLSFLYPNIWKW